VIESPPIGRLPCPTASEIAAIHARVALEFEEVDSGGTRVCTESEGSVGLTPLRERTYQAFLFMQRVEFDTPLPWTERNLFDWFADTVKGVRFHGSRAPFCCDPPGVIHMPAPAISPAELDESIPAYPLEALVHEARHIEFGPHTCGIGKDNTVVEMGAWGVQYSLALWLARHSSSLTAEQRDYALQRAAWLGSANFCRECPG
jgi:hypothetical protein